MSNWFQKRARQHTLLMHGHAMPTGQLDLKRSEVGKYKKGEKLGEGGTTQTKKKNGSQVYTESEHHWPCEAGSARNPGLHVGSSRDEPVCRFAVIEQSAHVVCARGSTMQRNLWHNGLRIFGATPRPKSQTCPAVRAVNSKRSTGGDDPVPGCRWLPRRSSLLLFRQLLPQGYIILLRREADAF